MLFPPSAADLTEFRYTRNRFTGDPTHIHRFHIGDQRIAIREENRLSAAMHLLDWETDIGPKGSLQVDLSGIVQKNPYFSGVNDPTDLGAYVHHRLPKSPESFAPSTYLCPAAGDSAVDFLEGINRDYPPGCWVLRNDPVHEVVRLQNLWWPGFLFYCCSNSAEFATLYIGLGDRNDDLPFMM